MLAFSAQLTSADTMVTLVTLSFSVEGLVCVNAVSYLSFAYRYPSMLSILLSIRIDVDGSISFYSRWFDRLSAIALQNLITNFFY